MIRRPLTANADVLVGSAAGRDGIAQQLLDRGITLVEQVGDDAGVTVQAQCQLGQSAPGTLRPAARWRAARTS